MRFHALFDTIVRDRDRVLHSDSIERKGSTASVRPGGHQPALLAALKTLREGSGTCIMPTRAVHGHARLPRDSFATKKIAIELCRTSAKGCFDIDFYGPTPKPSIA